MTAKPILKMCAWDVFAYANLVTWVQSQILAVFGEHFKYERGVVLYSFKIDNNRYLEYFQVRNFKSLVSYKLSLCNDTNYINNQKHDTSTLRKHHVCIIKHVVLKCSFNPIILLEFGNIGVAYITITKMLSSLFQCMQDDESKWTKQVLSLQGKSVKQNGE